jgi:hypothetical protein
MFLLIFLFGSYIINAFKLVSSPQIKVKTKPVHLRKPMNPWTMRKMHHTTPPPNFLAHQPSRTLYLEKTDR